MKILNILMLMLAVLVSALVVLNWTVLVTAVDLSFGIFQLPHPLEFCCSASQRP